jgi:hypothetical protein
MPALLERGRGEFGATAFRSVLRVRGVALVTIRKAEMQTGPRRVIQFAGRQIVAHHVPPVVVEPQFAGPRIPVETNGVADAPGEDFHAAAVGLHAVNDAIDVRIRLADVAGSTHRHIQPAVRPEGDIFPAVVPVFREAVAYYDGFGRGREPVLDVVEAQDPVDFGDIQGPVPEGNAVRRIESPCNGDDPVRMARLPGVHQRIDTAFTAGADEDCSLVPQSQRAGIVHVFGEDLDPESGRQHDALDRRTGGERIAAHGCQTGAKQERCERPHGRAPCSRAGSDRDGFRKDRRPDPRFPAGLLKAAIVP